MNYKSSGVTVDEYTSQDCRLFDSFEHIQQYIYALLENGTCVNLNCLVIKTEERDTQKCPIQSMYRYAGADKTVTNNKWHDVCDIIKIKNKVVLYGSGANCNLIMSELYKNCLDDKISFLLDSNPDRAGSAFRGKMIYYPTAERLKDIELVIITSLLYESQMEYMLEEIGFSLDSIVKMSEI